MMKHDGHEMQHGVVSHGLTGKVKMSWAMEPAAASIARRQCFNSASRRNLMSKRVENPAKESVMIGIVRALGMGMGA